MFWELTFPVQIPVGRVPDVGCQPLAPTGKTPVFQDPLPPVCCHSRDGLFCETMYVSVSPSHLKGTSYPLLWRAVHPVLRSFSEGNDTYVAVDLLCP